MKKMFKSSKYVVLESKNNIYVAIGMLVLAIVIGVLMFSKSMMGDDRTVMGENADSKIIMPMVEIETHGFMWNQSENLGELRLTETKSNPKSEYDISYVVYDEAGNELPMKVIRGSYQKEHEDDIETKQEIYIDFGLYDEFYFVTVEVQQKDSTSEKIVMDYRNFDLKNIKEKGENYLVNLEAEQAVLKELESELIPYQEAIQAQNEKLEQIDALTPDEKEKRVGEVEKIRSEIEKIQKEMAPRQEKVNQQQKKINEMREK